MKEIIENFLIKSIDWIVFLLIYFILFFGKKWRLKRLSIIDEVDGFIVATANHSRVAGVKAIDCLSDSLQVSHQLWMKCGKIEQIAVQLMCEKDWITLIRDLVRCPQSHGLMLSFSTTVNWPSMRSVICWALWLHWNSSPDSDDVNSLVGSVRWNATSLTDDFSCTV